MEREDVPPKTDLSPPNNHRAHQPDGLMWSATILTAYSRSFPISAQMPIIFLRSGSTSTYTAWRHTQRQTGLLRGLIGLWERQPFGHHFHELQSRGSQRTGLYRLWRSPIRREGREAFICGSQCATYVYIDGFANVEANIALLRRMDDQLDAQVLFLETICGAVSMLFDGCYGFCCCWRRGKLLAQPSNECEQPSSILVLGRTDNTLEYGRVNQTMFKDSQTC